MAFGPKGAVIIGVDPEGAAGAAGLQSGDEVLLVNGSPPLDMMDFLDRAEGRVQLRIRREGQESETWLERSPEEPLGLEFSDTLFNRTKTCRNKCVFCFMDQMPKKMRASLYYRDDDYRLSNLHGNFITLTNMADEEWERIRTQRVSPLYVSVHATDEDLRERLLGSTRQARMSIMDRLRAFQEWGIQIHTQIVLMPGLNDGVELDRSLTDLLSLGDTVETISVVPVGLTKYRRHLPDLHPVTPEMIRPLLAQVRPYQERCLEERGEPVVFLADEMYLIGGLPMPPHSHYGDYPQLENGVGMVRRFQVDFRRRLQHLPREHQANWILVTGEYGGIIFPPLIEELHKRVKGLHIELRALENEFFGDLVRCSGLLTGRDVYAALQGADAPVLIPGNALKDAAVVGNSQAGLFLDDVSMQAIADRIGQPLVNAGSSCSDWLGTMFGRRDCFRVEPDGVNPAPLDIVQFPEHVARP